MLESLRSLWGEVCHVGWLETGDDVLVKFCNPSGKQESRIKAAVGGCDHRLVGVRRPVSDYYRGILSLSPHLPEVVSYCP